MTSLCEGPWPKLQNVVATANLGIELDLQKILRHHVVTAKYNQRFCSVIMRIRQPKTTAQLCASGKIVVTGAKSEDDSFAAAKQFACIVRELFSNAVLRDFEIQHMMATGDVQFPIRLESLVTMHSLDCIYEPELFPGAIYRMKQPKIAITVFTSGKVVLTGAKRRSDIDRAFAHLYPLLMEHRRQFAPPMRPPAMPQPVQHAPPQLLQQ